MGQEPAAAGGGAESGLTAIDAVSVGALRARLVLLGCSSTHLITDGLVAAVYPLLPIIALELGLSYSAVGSIRTVLVGSGSLFQLPASFATAWFGETLLLGLGTLWMSVGFAAMSLATGYWPLLLLSLAAGIGGAAQHPLASSLVSRAYEQRGRAGALSTLNFAGDVGKVLLPALAGVLVIAAGWRVSMAVLGTIGVVGALAFLLTTRGAARSDRSKAGNVKTGSGWGIKRRGAFAALSAIGMIDNGTRTSALTFLPFLLALKGFDTGTISLMVTLVFAFGALGKFGCGFLADRFGAVAVVVVTELVTVVSLLAVIPADPLLVFPVLAAFGFVLNGTSSALYGAVAEMVHIRSRARGFALFYTLSLGVGASTPILYGALADRTGIVEGLVAIAAVNLITVPLAFALRSR